MAITIRPAALRSARACKASAVIAPWLFSVSSMSVNTPTMLRRSLAGQEDKGNIRNVRRRPG
jgi:hypothetical protein